MPKLEMEEKTDLRQSEIPTQAQSERDDEPQLS